MQTQLLQATQAGKRGRCCGIEAIGAEVEPLKLRGEGGGQGGEEGGAGGTVQVGKGPGRVPQTNNQSSSEA